MFPIGQEEGIGHVIKELKLNNNEKLDTEFVLSKSYINNIKNPKDIKPKEIKKEKRLDLSEKNSYMFKSWKADNSPILPIIQIENDKDETTKLWIHTNAIAERLTLSSEKSLEIFSEKYESFPLLKIWENYLSENISNASKFNLGEKNEAISLCIYLNSENEIINWSFHLTLVKCSLIVENKHTEALLTRKSKGRINSRVLKPIKEYIQDLDKILEIATEFRTTQLSNGKVEISKPLNYIESLDEFIFCNPGEYSNQYFEALNNTDCQSYLSSILYEADLIWFKHSNKFGLKSAAYISKEFDNANLSEIIKYSELVESNLELNDDGNLTFRQLLSLCIDDDKRRVLNKLFINSLIDKEVTLISENSDINLPENFINSPWTLPSYDFTNLINQYNILNMIVNGKRANKNDTNYINIMEMDSYKKVNWEIYNSSIKKNIDLLFNNYLIDKLNEYKNKVKQYKANMITIKQVRKAEKYIGKSFNGIIIAVQSYGFFVEIADLNVEGLVHVSTLNNDWYEYRSRQNLLIGRKSKKSYKIGDKIEIKIIKVDILKYQIDLELI